MVEIHLDTDLDLDWYSVSRHKNLEDGENPFESGSFPTHCGGLKAITACLEMEIQAK